MNRVIYVLLLAVFLSFPAIAAIDPWQTREELVADIEAEIAAAAGGASQLSELDDVDSTVSSPSDGQILVYRSAGSDWILEAKPASGSSPDWGDINGTLSNQTDFKVH